MQGETRSGVLKLTDEDKSSNGGDSRIIATKEKFVLYITGHICLDR
jgi:hypothetical protein